MKKNLKLVLVFLLAITLTGCMKINLIVDIDEKGNGGVSGELLCSQEVLLTTKSGYEELKAELISELDSSGSGVGGYEDISRIIDGVEYVGISFEEDTGYGDSHIASVDENKVTLELPAEDLIAMAGGYDKETVESLGYTTESLKAEEAEINMIFNMPGEATTNMGVADGNTVTIDLFYIIENPPTEDLLITATIKEKASTTTTTNTKSPDENNDNTLMYAGIATVVGAIAGVLVVVIILKEEKNSDESVIYDD